MLLPPGAARIAAAATLLLALAAAPRSAAAAEPVTVTVPMTVTAPADASCARCHAKTVDAQLKRKVVHAPFRSRTACGSCHEPHAPGEKGRLVAPERELCGRCHRGEDLGRARVHPIIEDGGCTACHAPHASDQPKLLAEPAATLCGNCHSDLAPKHGGLPVDGKRCLSCHSPHTASRPKLLREVVHGAMPDCSSCHAPKKGAPFARSEKEPALCFQCHDGVEKQLRQKTVHPPAKDGSCTACHSPHVADREKLLVEARPALCFGCHAELEEKLSKAPAAHPPARQGRCGKCHEPHASPAPKLLAGPAGALCLECHPGARSWAAARSAHDPVRSGDCTLCHDPHGGGKRLLVKDGGALCAECHAVQAEERKKAEQKKANAHPPVAAGECLSCHVPHAADAAPLLAARTEDLCVRCHAAMYDQRASGPLHRPFAARRCSACHVGHGDRPRLLSSANPCASCHGAAVKRWSAGRSQHAPVAAGACASCHDPHGAPAPRFLRSAGAALCLGCHEPLAKRIAAKGAVVHAPVRDGACDRCHEPHAAGERKLLSAAPPALCAECHDLASAGMARAHEPFDARAARCTSCHDPHTSQRENLVGDTVHPPFDEHDCDTCHVRTRDGRPQAKPAISTVCADCHDLGKPGHEPVRAGRCIVCHSPHASPRAHLVVDASPGLCDRCHDRGRARWKKTHADAGAEGMACGDCHDGHMKKK